MSVANVFAALAAALLVSGAAGAQLRAARARDENPVTKVVTLLTDLVSTIEGEGAAEAETYDTFACFCKDKTLEKSETVTTSQATINTIATNIEVNTATKVGKQTDLSERQKKQDSLAKELEDMKTRSSVENAEFEAIVADYAKALDQLGKAVEAMHASKPASLVELRKTVGESLALASALNLMKAPQKKAVQVLLQEGVDPAAPEFEYQSSGIIETLESLVTTFEEKKSEEQSDWDLAKAATLDLETTLTGQMEENYNSMETLKEEISGLEETLATDRGSLIEEEATLKDDQEYLKDLTERCEARAADWDQRTQMRGGELKALKEALAILTEEVVDRDAAVNERALLQRAAPAQRKNSTLPAGTAHQVEGMKALLKDVLPGHGKAKAIVKAKAKAKEAPKTATAPASTQHVVALLKKEGSRLGSKMLSTLAAKLAKDPFAKVKVLVQQLIERLLKEANAEATKKGFCDQEVAQAKNNRDFRFSDVQKLSTDLGVLEAKKVSLEERIVELQENVLTLHEELNTTTDLREVEKEQNLQTIKTAKEGQSAVHEAIALLKSFYKHGAKFAFLEKSPVDADAPEVAEGSYGGAQDSAKGIIAILEVIASDFDHTASQTMATEKQAAADFVEYHREALSSIAGKEREGEIKAEELKKTENSLVSTMADLKTAQELLDAALMTLDDLKPVCIDTGMSYTDRVQKREEEIAALQEALTFLAESEDVGGGD